MSILGSKVQLENQNGKIGNIEYSVFTEVRPMFSPFKVKMNDFIAEKYPGTEKLLFF
jgi:2C-methyl-D-erythritol 2,4-cyclodiphosphate synthase